MTTAKHSELHLLMLQSSAKGFMSIAEAIEEILSTDNNLTEDEISFWIEQGQSILNVTKRYLEMGNILIEQENQRQTSVRQIVPFVNFKGSSLN